MNILLSPSAIKIADFAPAEGVRIDQEIRMQEEYSRERAGSRRIVLNSRKQWYQPSLIRMKAKRILD